MRLQAKITMQCMQCGKTVYKGDSYYSPMSAGNMFKDLTGLGGGTEVYCSKGCMNQATGGGGGGAARGGNGINNAAAKIEVERAQAQLDAEKDAIQDAKNDNYMSKLRSLTFTGDAQAVSTEMEDVYQMWISQNFVGTEENKKAQKKLVQEKLEYGLMSLKSLDAVKGKYYEDKINQEIAHRKKILKIKIIGGIVGVVVLIGFLLLTPVINE